MLSEYMQASPCTPVILVIIYVNSCGWIMDIQMDGYWGHRSEKRKKKKKKSVSVYRMLLELMSALPMYVSKSILSTYWVLVEGSERHVSLLASGNKKKHIEMILKKLFL